MKVVRKFVLAELLWTSGIFTLVLPMAILDGDPPGPSGYVRWLARAFSLALFPAGVAVAGDLFGQVRAWRPLLGVLATAALFAFFVFAIFAFVVPPLAGDMSLLELIHYQRTPPAAWESRNHAAWSLYTMLLAPVTALLFAAIGVQVGAWGRHALPQTLRRLLYWMVGLGLMITGYAVFDTTYEAIVLHTAADVAFAAFYTLLIPAGICAGLALPTLALLRGAEIRGSDA